MQAKDLIKKLSEDSINNGDRLFIELKTAVEKCITKTSEGGMMSEEKRYAAKAGNLLCAESGAYSDYRVKGFFVVLRDFMPNDELDLFVKDDPRQGEGYNFDEDKYLGFLISKGLLMQVNYDILYLTGYSSIEEFYFTPFKQ